MIPLYQKKLESEDYRATQIANFSRLSVQSETIESRQVYRTCELKSHKVSIKHMFYYVTCNYRTCELYTRSHNRTNVLSRFELEHMCYTWESFGVLYTWSRLGVRIDYTRKTIRSPDSTIRENRLGVLIHGVDSESWFVLYVNLIRSPIHGIDSEILNTFAKFQNMGILIISLLIRILKSHDMAQPNLKTQFKLQTMQN